MKVEKQEKTEVVFLVTLSHKEMECVRCALGNEYGLARTTEYKEVIGDLWTSFKNVSDE